MGKQYFNYFPSYGIKYLIGIGYIQNTPKDIANFLFHSEGLKKVQIGDYLSRRLETNKRVLIEYVDLFSFKVGNTFVHIFIGASLVGWLVMWLVGFIISVY
jgi:Sec7-like guanine-nucleotide exchange factor